LIDLDDLLVARIFVRDRDFREAFFLGGIFIIITFNSDGRERRRISS